MPSAACKLTFMMAVYGQPEMMRKWFETLRRYDDDVLDQLCFLVVDDHGTPPQTIPPDLRKMLDCRLYRVEKQIPWNQMGARNLGMAEAPSDWVVMMDPDMVVEPQVVKKLFNTAEKLTRGQAVKLFLHYTNDKADGSSPNVYLMHRLDFEMMGGYDEDYAGNKGWSDVQFMHTLEGFKIQLLKWPSLWVRYYRPRDIKDATVITLSRDVRINKSLHLRKMAQMKKMGAKRFIRARKPKLRFPWKRVT